MELAKLPFLKSQANQADSYQVVHMVQCTTNNSSDYWEVVLCTTKIFDETVKKGCKIKSNITKKKCIL